MTAAMARIGKPRPRTEPARLVLTTSPPATDQPLAPASIPAVSRRSATKEEKVMLEKIRAAKENESGFTLIELLIVIVILGVLAAIVVFSVGGINDTSKASACKSDAKNVEIASEAFYTQQTPHAYAASIDALVNAKLLREPPSTTNGYTIGYNAATGAVTATGACTL